MKNLLISGPVSYSKYKIDDKNIFMFGDVHYSKYYRCKEKSITIPKLINNLAKKYNNKYIDFFLEAPYSNIDSNYKSSFIQSYKTQLLTKTGFVEVQKYYEKYGCFTKNRKLCEYKFPNIRFHAADFRFSHCNENINMNNFIQILYVILEMVYKGIDSKIVKKFIPIIKNFDTIDKLYKNILKILQCEKIKTQFNKIDKIYSTKIDRFMKKQLLELKNKYKSDYNKNIKSVYDFLYKKPYNTFTFDLHIRKLIEIYVEMNAIIMDTYLLARLFKPYTKNIFIYAGDTHILRYQTFFEKILKNNPIDLGKQISYRCIKIKEITL